MIIYTFMDWGESSSSDSGIGLKPSIHPSKSTTSTGSLCIEKLFEMRITYHILRIRQYLLIKTVIMS